jgi:hypothetical protein
MGQVNNHEIECAHFINWPISHMLHTLELANSLSQYFLLLQSVDIFTKRASFCKKLAKITYFLLISMAALIIFASVVHADHEEYLGSKDLRVTIIALSLAASLLASLITYVDPAAQWQQLRGAALALEAEIWKFRTRTGQYSMSSKMHGDRGGSSVTGGEEALRCASSRLG